MTSTIRTTMRTFLALGVAATLSVLSAPVTLAVYYNSCGTSDNYHEYLNQASVDMVKAWGTIPALRALHQCTGSTGITFALPVNVQGGAFVQLGYLRGGSDTGGSFKFTSSDTSGGSMVGTSAAFPSVVLGHGFTFTVLKTTVSGVNKWQYTVKDNTTVVSGSAFGSRSVASLTGPLWAGFEVYDSDDAFGGLGASSYIRVSAIGWQSSSGGVFSIGSSTRFSCCGTKQSYWSTLSGTDSNGDKYIDGWTVDH